MKRTFAMLFVIAMSITNYVYSQDNNIGIGTTSPHESAILELNSSNQGILIPRLTLIDVNDDNSPVDNPADGLLIFNEGGSLENGFYYWDGSEWKMIGSGGGGTATCYTLQEAYECTGASEGGKIITENGSPLRVNSSHANNPSIQIVHEGNGVAIIGASTSGSTSYAAIQGTNATSQPSSAVYGLSEGGSFGVRGDVTSTATGESAVYGQNERTTGGHGVMGLGYNGTVGLTDKVDGFGIWGSNDATSDPGAGIYGLGVTGVGGQSTNTGLSYGIYSFDDGGIYNNLDVNFNFYAGGTKSFRIDHPLDPDNKFLVHYCVESDEVLNIYRGTTVLDAQGNATIELPEYFEAINTNFSYQLTPIGAAMPSLFVSNEITGNTFTVEGGVSGKKVSWVVIAERNDPLLKNNPEMRNPEPLKTGRYEGKYAHPEYYSKTEKDRIMFKETPDRSKIGKFEMTEQELMKDND